VTPGNRTKSRSGSTGRVSRSLISSPPASPDRALPGLALTRSSYLPEPSPRDSNSRDLSVSYSVPAREILHPQDLVLVLVVADCEADAKVGVPRLEDVAAVVGAVHPRLHDVLDRGLPGGEVLPDDVGRDAGRLHAPAGERALGAFMGVVGPRQHVLGVRLR